MLIQDYGLLMVYYTILPILFHLFNESINQFLNSFISVFSNLK